MPIRLPVLFLTVLAILLPAAHATTVVPPSFPELVGRADAIYRGHVTAVESRKVDRPDGAGTVIKTFVTFAVDKVLKGAAQNEVTLEFLGGKVDGESLSVSGMPKFAVGMQDYVFVEGNGRQFCPLVAVMHGRYKIMKDAGDAHEFIARDNGTPLADVSQVELPMSQLPAQVAAATVSSARAAALTPAAFESSIRSEVQTPTLRARLN